MDDAHFSATWMLRKAMWLSSTALKQDLRLHWGLGVCVQRRETHYEIGTPLKRKRCGGKWKGNGSPVPVVEVLDGM